MSMQREDKEIPALSLFLEIKNELHDNENYSVSDEVIATLVMAQSIAEATSHLETISDTLQEMER